MIIKLMGGLGNQMFQYALYKKLDYLEKKISIDDRELRKRGNQHNGLELERVFGLKYRRTKNEEFMKLYLKRAVAKTDRIITGKGVNSCVLIDDLATPFEKIIDGGFSYLDGYWQNEEYFKDIEELIKKDFSFVISSEDKKNIEIANEIRLCNSVSIHVRRGDYLQNQDVAYICDNDYYKTAMEIIKDLYGNCHFYVFSDDKKWIRYTFGNSQDITIIDWNEGNNSYMDMYLMSMCKSNIICASSFSWWGAWLNKNKEKTVICPKQWYTKYKANPALEEWIQL